MTRHEQLRENYEDALFALLMEQVMEQEGSELIEENERLKRDPSAAVPERTDARCIRTRRRAFSKERQRTAVRISYRIVSKVAIVAFISILFFTTAFAAFPELSIRTLNMLIEVSDVATKLTMGERLDTPENDQSSNKPNTENSKEQLRCYRLPEIPDGFKLYDEDSNSVMSYVKYSDDNGAKVSISVYSDARTAVSLDTENAEVENVKVHGYDGLLVIKGDRIQLIWCDTDQNNFMHLHCENFDSELVIQMAEQMVYIGE